MTPIEEVGAVTVGTWTLEDDGRVTAAVRWSTTPELDYELSLEPTGRLVGFTARATEGHAVAATRLRRAPIGEMQAAVRASIFHGIDVLLQSSRDVALDLDEHGHVQWDAPGRPATRRASQAEKRAWDKRRSSLVRIAARLDSGSVDQTIAATAALYADLFARGVLQPYEQLADELGVGKKVAQNRIYKARERGYLTSEGRGRAGGVLTDRAREILAGEGTK